MIRRNNLQLAKQIKNNLVSYSRKNSLPGIRSSKNLNCLVEQMIDSVKRIKYVKLVSGKEVSKVNLDVSSGLFDPLKGAIWHMQNGNLDEAFWLVFLATHFGKNKNSGWRLIRSVYGGLGEEPFWTWERITANVGEFRTWIEDHQQEIKLSGHFGNHRKYESLSGLKKRGTGAALASYVKWVGGQHELLISIAKDQVGEDPRLLFNCLYNSMDVMSFGRTAKFDYLTMVGKMGLVDIEPGSTYLNGATGPFRGARLLFGGNKRKEELEKLLNDLEAHLGLYYGMQVLEDSLCNWQKSPNEYLYFGG